MLSSVVVELGLIPELAGRVQLAVNVADVLAEQWDGPRVWICEPKGFADPNQAINRTTQRREVSFVVLSLVSGAADATAADVLTASDALRQTIRNRLLGFVPAEGFAPIELRRDGLAKSADLQLYWADQYRTDHYVRSQE